MPAPTRCWCSSSTPSWPRPRAEDFVAELLGRADRRRRGGDRRGFHLRQGRGGNVAVLRELGAAHGIAAEAVAPVALDGEPVSSSRIREALKAGDPGPRPIC